MFSCLFHDHESRISWCFLLFSSRFFSVPFLDIPLQMPLPRMITFWVMKSPSVFLIGQHSFKVTSISWYHFIHCVSNLSKADFQKLNFSNLIVTSVIQVIPTGCTEVRTGCEGTAWSDGHIQINLGTPILQETAALSVPSATVAITFSHGKILSKA